MSSPLPFSLPIRPFARPVRGAVALPGSKSITNRALLLAGLCGQNVSLTGALFSEDTKLMSEALKRLGLTIYPDGDRNAIGVSGQKNLFTVDQTDLFVGLAGTAARFLTALCAAAPKGVHRIDGVSQMRKRPMRPLIEALRQLGANIRCSGEEGFFPIEVHACGLRGGRVEIDARESSQLLSALLMVAPLAQAPVEIVLTGEVRWPFVNMTGRLMEQFGQPPFERKGGNILLVGNTHPYRLPSSLYEIEPDATAASYFLALPLVAGGHVSLPGLRAAGKSLQGDTVFLDVLQRAGLSAAPLVNGPGLEVSHAAGSGRRGLTEDFSGFSDTFLTLAAIAPLLDGPTRITGIAHTRKQETDRVAGMARELQKLGQRVVETEDSLEIHPRPLNPGVEIETYHDHRFAMSFAILGCHDLLGNGRPWLTIKDPACCAKTFPDFFDVLEKLRASPS